MKKIYLYPSDQVENLYAVGDTNEAVQCRKIAEALLPALELCGFMAKTDITDEASMYDRVRQSNEWGADLHIAIHTNAHNTKVKGTRLFCYDKTGEGYQACAAIMATLAPITPGNSDNITVLHFYEVRDAKAPTVYLEVAFHDNPEEARWIIENTERIAEAVCQGVCAHYGVDYVNPEAPETEEENEDVFYRVQVGAFKHRANAERRLEELKAAGFSDAYICT